MVPEYLGHWSRDSEIISSDILQVSLRLSLCQRNAPNYRPNNEFLEGFFWSINWLLATFCDTLITIRENHWLLRII